LSEGGRPSFGLRFGSGSRGFNSFYWSSYMNCWYLVIGSPPIALYRKILYKSNILTCCLYNIKCFL
jgi:hypothetical protein